jgi:single-strand DNA-binding protein
MFVTNLRLGRDAEVNFTNSGSAVANLAGCYEYGMKGADGKRPVQWIDAALFGKQAEAMAPYLVKGTVVLVSLSDVHVETYQGKNGQMTKLVGRVAQIEFAPSQPQRDSHPKQAIQPKQQAASFDDSDRIPF